MRETKEEPVERKGPELGRGRGPGFGAHRGGPGAIMMPVAKAKDFKGTMRKLIAYLHDYRLPIISTVVLALISTMFSIFSPKILGGATTILFQGVIDMSAGTGSIDLKKVGSIILLVAFLYLASALCSFIQGWIMSGISVQVTYQFRKDISEKIRLMPLGYFESVGHGEVLSRITNDVDVVSQTLNQGLIQIISSVATVIGVVIMMTTISWIMTLVALCVIPMSLLFVRFIIKRSQKLFKEQQEGLGKVNAHVEEMYGGHVVMKAFNGEAKSIATFNGFNEQLYSSAWKANFLSGLMMPVMGFIGNLGYVGVTITGGVLALRKMVTVGDIQAFIQYVRSFIHPLSALANLSNVLQQTAAAAERVFEFLDEQEEEDLEHNAMEMECNGGVPQTGRIQGRVEFKDIHFGYSKDKTIIHGFSALAEEGQKIAIVGPTGAGKTTIVKLLMRFYDVDSGTILVDGRDLRSFTRTTLRSFFGMVLQDTWLFHGTIKENISYGHPEASEEEVYAAARTAHADHFIRAQPKGYDTMINEEGDNISQGQKQLLTIARAILANPRMLILDEATSSVDTRTEILIQRAMDNLMLNRTSFIIAHRLSTVKNADLILVMKEGNIVETGTHTQLLSSGGAYAEIYESQFDVPVA